MITAGRVRERPRSLWGIPPAVVGAIVLAWVIAAVAQATGRGRLLQHDALIHSGLPLWVALGVHLVAWQAMIAAMMLPSSIPLVRLFAVVSRNQDRPAAAMGSFLGGYALVWTGFGAFAFLGDVMMHRTVHSSPWLAERPWLVAGSVLALAGAFQFSSLKDQCLRACRRPSGFLIQRYGRGPGTAFRVGRDHGLFCLGCCWALMVVMFAAGVASLWWMAALGALMFYEKVGRHGAWVTPAAGISLLAMACLVLLHPGWFPSVLGGSA